MNLSDLTAGQAVLWHNARGRLVCATVVAVQAAHTTAVIAAGRGGHDIRQFQVATDALIGAGEQVIWERLEARIVAVHAKQNVVDIAMPAGGVRRVTARTLTPLEAYGQVEKRPGR